MNILVTVGTTKFDGLMAWLDTHFKDSPHRFTMQIADGSYQPVNFPWFTFTDDIERHYRESDMIITHGGAGSVYRLLEMGKRLIVVPNLERNDRHQLDLATVMAERDHVLMVTDFDDLASAIDRCGTHDFKPYQREPFHAAADIFCFLNEKKGS